MTRSSSRARSSHRRRRRGQSVAHHRRLLRGELLEPRRLLATLEFIGSELTFVANDGVENDVTLSLAGDTYTFHDAGETIKRVRRAPKACSVDGLRTNTVTLTCADANISSISFELGDSPDSLAVESARDGLVVNGGDASDAVYLANKLNLNGQLTVDAETITLTDSGQLDFGIETIGDQFYGGHVLLTAEALFVTPANLTFASNVDGGYALSMVVAGTGTLAGDVGSSSPLASFDTSSGGITIFSGGAAATFGDQAYGNPVLLDGDLAVDGATITFLDTVDSGALTAANLTVRASETVSAARPVGANAPLAALSITANEALTISTAIHSNGTVDLTVLDSAIGEQDIVIEAAGSIQSTGGDILLRAGDDLDLRPNATLTALGVVSLWGDFGNADLGSGTAIMFSGTVAGAVVDLAGDADNDIFIIDDNGEELGGTVNHLLVATSVDGRGGNDTIVLNDESETVATTLKVVAGRVGTSVTDNLFAPNVGLSYTDVEDLQILTGSGDDHVTFASTHSGSTSVNTGSGSDTILVSALNGPTSVMTGDDDDAVQVSSEFQVLSDINGALTVNGGSSTTGDVLVLDDSGNSQSVAATLTANSFSHSSAAAITYESIDRLDVLLGQANDQLTIASTHLGTTLINSGAGGRHR